MKIPKVELHADEPDSVCVTVTSQPLKSVVVQSLQKIHWELRADAVGAAIGGHFHDN
ncbi:MAG TPA: hypothetical protein VFZ73_07990 [Gemmatimonadaceae bacterium]